MSLADPDYTHLFAAFRLEGQSDCAGHQLCVVVYDTQGATLDCGNSLRHLSIYVWDFKACKTSVGLKAKLMGRISARDFSSPRPVKT